MIFLNYLIKSHCPEDKGGAFLGQELAQKLLLNDAQYVFQGVARWALTAFVFVVQYFVHIVHEPFTG